MDRKTLTVYSASAGSGKTYNLVKEFLLLLFLNHYAPHSDLGERVLRSKTTGDRYFGFQGILGVTFTKKATLELKQRILRELIRLGGVQPGEEITGISRDVIKELSDLVGKTEQELSSELPPLSKVAVKQILEDYSHFNVRTIDSFFQEVLRALRHEITGQSVSGSYQIELNVEEAVNLAIDNLKLEMDANTYSEISRVVLTLQNGSIGKEKQVDPFKEIADIAYRLINGDEWEQIKSDLLSQKAQQLVSQNQQYLKGVVDDYEKKLRPITTIAKKISEYNPYRWGSKIKSISTIDNIADAILLEGLTQSAVSKWKLTDKDKEYEGVIYPLRDQVANLLPASGAKKYVNARLLLDYLAYIPILAEIAKSIEEYEHQNHLLLIPRVNQLLDQIIDGDDTPFVYDRVGVRLHHFVIDEFQDTSRLQWSNFRPLIDEARSSGHENFIVGDAKQSIYAFRGTDSSNFITLVDKSKTGSDNTAEVINLPNNWRSDERIISFNNEFFADIYNYNGYYTEEYDTDLTQLHKTVYERENVEQQVPDQKKASRSGYVEVSVLPDNKKDESIPDVETYLHSCLKDLFARGYQPGDIAILSRGNKECANVATWLTEWAAEEDDEAGKYDFVSKSALSLTSSVVIRLLRTLIRALSSPSSQSEKLLRLMIQSYVRSRDLESGEQQVESLYNSLMNLSTTGLSVYEFLLRAIDLLGELPVEERLYVNSFIDLAYSYSRRSPDLSIRQFDDWLDQNIEKAKVDMGSGELNRINVLTIHDAKGLEFPVVILPFADWDIYSTNRRKRDLRLIRIAEDDPNLSSDLKPGIYLIDMNDSKRGLASSLAHIYEAAREVGYMEETNILYVAFTRAVSELYVFTKPKSERNTVIRINNIILDRLNKLGDLKGDLIKEERQGITVWRSNVAEKPQRKLEGATTPSHNQTTLDSLVSIVDLEDLKVRDEYADEKTDFGILIHRLMASVYSKEDVKPLLDKLYQSGRISSEDYRTLLQNFASAMEDPTYASWFPPRGEAVVRTEATLFDSKSSKEQRPDRVVIRSDSEGKRYGVIIDYKLGEDPSSIPDAYSRQVRRYVDQLRKSGVENVTGYLWYLRSPNGIIKVC